MSKLMEMSAARLNEVFGEPDVLIIKAITGKEDFSCVVGDLLDVSVEMAG